MKPELIQLFYNRQILTLRDDVTLAEQARQEGNHQKVMDIFDYWIKSNRYERILTELQDRKGSGLNLTEEEDLIKAGLAGLGRIEHVDANSQLKSPFEEAKALASRRTIWVYALYGSLNIDTLPPWTIHESAIFWPAEIAQDKAKTLVLSGYDPKLAGKVIDQALIDIPNINLDVGDIDFKTPDQILKAEDYLSYRARKRFLGAFSGQGVLWLRKAEIDKKLEYMTRALNFLSLVHIHEPNSHRLATVATRVMLASLSSSYQGSVGERFNSLCLGSYGIMQALSSNWEDTLSSLKQSFRERK